MNQIASAAAGEYARPALLPAAAWAPGAAWTLTQGAGAGLLLALAHDPSLAAWPSASPLLGLSGMLLLAQLLRQQQPWWGVALALAVWQLGGMAWLARALPAPADAALPALFALLLLLNLGSLLPLALLLQGVLARLLPGATGIAWPLAWWLWQGLREPLWWGGSYAGLSLALLDLPVARWLLPLLGQAGFEALLWALAVALCALLASPVQRRTLRRRGLALLLALGACALMLGAAPPNWTQAVDTPQTIGAVAAAKRQGWSQDIRDAALGQLHTAMAQAPSGSLLVSSETFFAEAPPRHPEGVWLDLLADLSAKAQHLLIGLPMPYRSAQEQGLMNAVLQLSPSNSDASALRGSLYAKQRLAPAGEALPWPALLRPLLAYWQIAPRSNELLAGPAELAEPLFVNGLGVAVSICHELAFGEALRRSAADAHWLLNVADDSWIDDPGYALQVERLARLRAMEAGRPLLRVSQGSGSLLVDADGSLLGRWPAGAPAALLQLQPRQGLTPYLRWGELTALLVPASVALLLAALALLSAFKKLKQP